MQTTLTTPDWAVWLIGMALTWLVTQGIKSLSRSIPWMPNLTGNATALVAALVAMVVTIANGALAALPPATAEHVAQGFLFISILLSAYGVQYTVKSLK